MEKLSPRSYVTGGFDIIKPSLIEFIGKVLEKTWRHYYIYTKLKKNNSNIATQNPLSPPKIGHYTY
jgi:hypothetical protein